MNNFWSTSVQSSKLLHDSRDVRINKYNYNTWLEILQVKDNLNILEVGCGAGTFSLFIKEMYPSCRVTAIDCDENHITFAKQLANGKNLDVNFMLANINNLPFSDNSFDLVFSHTVIEHLPIKQFLSEQYRVLKVGGKIISLNVEGKFQQTNLVFKDSKKTIELKDKLFTKLSDIKVGTFSPTPSDKLIGFRDFGFNNVTLDFKNILWYCPENYRSDPEFVKKCIMSFCTSEMESLKMHNNMFKTLTDSEFATLEKLVNKKYEKRYNDFVNNKIINDYQSTCLCVISAIK